MHVDRWINEYESFKAFCRSRKWHGSAFDQGLLLEYFVGDHTRSVQLPNTWNWKGYWGWPDESEGEIVIAHFHGPKPKKCADLAGNAQLCPHKPYYPFLHNEMLYPTLLDRFRNYYNQTNACDSKATEYSALSTLTEEIKPC